jgi:SAM-dependent methyltransferase
MTRSARPNSFHFVPVRDVMRAAGEPCPLARDSALLDASLGATARERQVFLRFRDRMRLFETRTTDFTVPEIQRIRALGQLYMDVSAKHAPDDFSRDLRKLALASECEVCPELSRCAGCLTALSADVFQKDEAHVLRRLRELDGDVLDVGAGQAPYAAALAPGVERGHTRYVAVDPDAGRLELLRQRFPWADTRVGTIEDLVHDERRFRHVLFLRSYNHLDEPARALLAARELLEPGGKLLVADDVAFGLVRSLEQARRAESSEAVAFEHHRNDGAEEAHAEITRIGGFSLVERRDASQIASNLWLLWYRKSD